MFTKLAIRNVRKSFQNYVIYFVTLIIAVALFFCFNMFQQQGLLLAANPGPTLETTKTIMSMLAVFVAIILGFLICYSNIFMMRKRSMEMATYMLLGMKKRTMSLILSLEVMIVGFVALCIGILLGIFASQFLMSYISNVLSGSVHYQFTFSFEALYTTIASFALLFFVVILVSLFAMNRLKLIDLIYADKKVEMAPIQNIGTASLICLVSLIGFGITYYLGFTSLLSQTTLILIIGGISTILFFLSLSGFIVALSSKFKKLYYKNLNMYSIRQINANIGSNFLSMSMVCLLVLVSIMALSIGFSFNTIMDSDVNNLDIGGDARIVTRYNQYFTIAEENEEYYALQKSFVEDIKNISYVGSVETKSVYSATSGGTPYNFILLEDMNAWRTQQGLEEIVIPMNTAIFVPGPITVEDENGELETQTEEEYFGGDFTLEDKKIQVVPYAMGTDESLRMYYVGNLNSYYLIHAEQLNIRESNLVGEEVMTILNYKNDSDGQAFVEEVNRIYENNYKSQFCELAPNSRECSTDGDVFINLYSLQTQADIEATALGNKVIFTFMALYLGFVFIVVSAVVLAIQLISHATSQKEQYGILFKIGASSKQIRNTVITQCATYFMIPMSLAIFHSIFGIASFANSMPIETERSAFIDGVFPMGIILVVVYGIYFVITTMNYYKIIKKQ